MQLEYQMNGYILIVARWLPEPQKLSAVETGGKRGPKSVSD
jgi:hypothetical protein